MMAVRCSGDVASSISGHFPRRGRPRNGISSRFWDASKLRVESEKDDALPFTVSMLKTAAPLVGNPIGPQQLVTRPLMTLSLCDRASLRPVKACGLRSERVPSLNKNLHEGKSHYKLPPMALLFANVLMLVEPFEASAETCQATDSMFKMPILLAVALIGATVGGLLARQRKGELQRVNEQLRQINTALRRQAKIESYAPSLSYTPVGKVAESQVIVDPRKQELISRLKAGKSFLRSQNPEKAFFEFKAALELAQNLKDPIEEKKAARGLGASLQRQGKYQEAIKYHLMVLDISKREGEHSGSTEAYGAIADCYTELGDLEQAGKYYDRYIARLESD
uniref:Uncharacterized protein n=1 Tax=Kalanchoe fedtschenkoi TaxID=63787 RepID=A0A7N0TYM9_KALFE